MVSKLVFTIVKWFLNWYLISNQDFNNQLHNKINQ